jgi:hypothetical protein
MRARRRVRRGGELGQLAEKSLKVPGSHRSQPTGRALRHSAQGGILVWLGPDAASMEVINV